MDHNPHHPHPEKLRKVKKLTEVTLCQSRDSNLCPSDRNTSSGSQFSLDLLPKPFFEMSWVLMPILPCMMGDIFSNPGLSLD